MTTEATAAAPLKMQNAETKPKRAPRVLTLEQFRRRFSEREDGYKYEFDNGIVEKSPSNINAKQMYIVKNLNRRFIQTQAFASGDELTPEVEQITAPNPSRRPDLSYWPSSKIKQGDETTKVIICEGDTVCSAAPVVPDFEIAAKDIFIK